MVETAARVQGGGGVGELFLPPGFRFYPTHEEVVMKYLLPKVLDPSFVSLAVGEVDLNGCEPRELPEKANMGEKEWYFFVHKDMKYPTGMRANRATKEGYWKATGKDREILSAVDGELVGMKKTLVFYTGRAPRGGKTNWVMHEFRLDGKSRHQTINNPKDEWVVCKVFNKKGEGEIMAPSNAGGDNVAGYSAGTTPDASSSEVDVGDFLDYSMLDPCYFDNYMTTATIITEPTAAAHSVNAGYSVPTTAGIMPNYSLTNDAAGNTQTQVAAAMASSIPTSSYMLNIPAAVHEMGRNLGGFIGASVYGVPAPIAPSITGTVPQQKSNDDVEYAYGNYGVGAAAAAMNGQPAAATSVKNFDGRSAPELLMDIDFH